MRIAMVLPNGEVGSICYPSQSDMYVSGEEYGGAVARVIETSVDDTTILNEWYYFENGWKIDKPERPGSYYNWEDAAWVLDTEELWQQIRSARDTLLNKSDWTQNADSPLTDEKKAEWVTYRASLRNVPAANSGATDLNSITWPTKPSQ
jgi:hypothetical protein